jgi:NodT family efflux transporter outer membrane factor (OMF) lipoprotein
MKSYVTAANKTVIALALLFFSGCKVGHRYHRPNIPVPDKFAQQLQASDKADLANWWTFFQDPYLNTLIEKALANNYDMRIAIEKIKEMRAIYRIQNAKLFPEVDGTAVATGNALSNKTLIDSYLPKTHFAYFQLGFDAIWEMDFWGKQQSARDGAYAEYQAGIENMRDVYIILLGDVAKTYIDIRTLQKKIDLTQQQIDINTKLLFLTKDRLQSGVASEIPDTEQQAALDDSKSQLVLLQTSFKQAVNQMAVLLGENPEQFVLQPGKHTVPESKKTLGIGLPSELLRRRPDIRKAESLLTAAVEYVGQAIADWFPSFSLLGSIGTQVNKIPNLFTNGSISWSIGPSLRLPILTFGRIKFNVQAKKSAQQQALLAYGQSVVTALGDVENSLVAYFNEKDRKNIIEEKLFAVTRERDLVSSLFQSGLDNQTDYLQAEKNRIAAELTLTDVKQSVSTALVSVYKALGGGW